MKIETYVEDLMCDKVLDPEYVGGKASLLNAVAHLGLRISPGFVLTTKFYEKLIQFDRYFALAIESMQQMIGRKGEIYFTKNASYLTNDVISVISSFINENINKLQGNNFIVRSSANLEGFLPLSFSGIFNSYIDLSRNQIASAIRDCYLSIFSKRAIAYLEYYSSVYEKQSNELMHSLKLAVIVQQMIDQKVSGNSVINWTNPNGGKILLEIQTGPNHQLTSGKAVGHSIIVNFTYMNHILFINKPRSAQQVLLDLEIFNEGLHQLCKVFVSSSQALGQSHVAFEWALTHRSEIIILQIRLAG